MASLYPSWTNPVYRGVLLALVLLPTLGIVGLMVYVRTPYNTDQYVVVDQPVQFDHRHHVLDDHIACLYCHTGAETEARAGVPAADVCMGCHTQIWNDSPLLAPVRRASFEKRPIAWRRVHDLADFVYFHHGVHVQAGLECSACHGDVAKMASVYKAESLQMGFCVDCHQKQEERMAQRLTKSEELTPGLEARIPPPEHVGPWETAQGRLPGPLTTCTACHR